MDFSELSFPDAPLIRIAPPGPKSKEYLEFQRAHESSAVSYSRGLPMALHRGRGATVEDVDGNRYIDFFGGAAVLNVGHGNPPVVEAAVRQLQSLSHALDVPTPARRDLVEKLLMVLPAGLDLLLFGGPTGSDAVEAAVKLAKSGSGRFPLIAFEGSYHGMSSGALALTSGLYFKEDFLPLIPEVHFVPYAYCYRCVFQRDRSSCALDCAAFLEHVLKDPHSGVGKPAAVIIEAIQGEGGTVVPPEGYLPQISRICRKQGVLLILDEIQAGFCRTGRMFSCEHTGVVPDILTMSKALGGIGLPISAVAYRKELDGWAPGKHIGTYRGNVAAYAAGAAALDFLVEHQLADHAESLGGEMLDWLKEMEKSSRLVGEARGKGLMLGIELVKDKHSKEPAPEEARRVRSACHRRGLLVEIGGHYDNVVRFLPPLVLTRELAMKGVEIFEDALRAVEADGEPA
jgi:diaminobutyrate-2-oxoglutarate transaminase